MSELLISGASAPGPDGAIVSFEAESVGFDYVGFEVLALEGGGTAERACGIRPRAHERAPVSRLTA